MQAFITWCRDALLGWGAWGIFLGMALESSFVPFPSEVIMIPWGYFSAQGHMAWPWVLALGILGSLAGALVNYYLAVWLGRPALARWGRYVLISPVQVERMEVFFRRHGEITTFVGRLIPGVRQYISFPAGLARMPMLRFLTYTGLGAGIWSGILLWAGWVLGKQLQGLDPADPGFMRAANERLEPTYPWLAVALALIVALYVLWRRWQARELAQTGTGA